MGDGDLPGEKHAITVNLDGAAEMTIHNKNVDEVADTRIINDVYNSESGSTSHSLIQMFDRSYVDNEEHRIYIENQDTSGKGVMTVIGKPVYQNISDFYDLYQMLVKTPYGNTTITGDRVIAFRADSGSTKGVSIRHTSPDNVGLYDERFSEWIVISSTNRKTTLQGSEVYVNASAGNGAINVGETLTANITLTDAKNYNNNSDNQPICYKWGKCVTIRGIVSPKSQVASGGTLSIGTIPAGYRPAKGMYAVCQGSGVNRWMLKAEASGALTMERYGASGNAACPTDAYLCITITYVIA
jgi:hypothetical protein